MFHFSNRQLHIMISFLVASMLLIAAFIVVRNNEGILLKGKIKGLDDFSDGWIASYETLDDAKWRKFGNTDDKNAKKYITEVLNLPNTFDIKADNYLILTHKLPDYSNEEEYLVFYSRNQFIQILANKDLIYESTEKDILFPYHIVSIAPQYANADLTIKIKSYDEDKVALENIRIGTFTELLAQSIKDDGWLVVYGILLILIGIALFAVIVSVKSRAPKKYLLNYIWTEAFFTGILLCIKSSLFRTVIYWEMLNYFLISMGIIIVTVIHLFVIRCMINKVKILSVIDVGIIIYCIEFISIIILSWFRLVSFDLIYNIVVALSVIGVVLFTLLVGIASYDYRQKEGRPVFVSNLILLGSAILALVLYVTHSETIVYYMPVIIGSFIYFVILIKYGIGQAVVVSENDMDDVGDKDEIVRQQVIESFNPNLLFASFQTLQNMIKTGSENSTKMIYYISMYVMDNIKAINNRGEIISFEDELEHIMAYLNLQRTRNSKLSFVIESKVKDFKIPRNTIEPLVEKAVKYGIGGKDNSGNVVVRTYTREDGYAIQIIDNGIGFDTSNLKNTGATSLKHLLDILTDKCKAKTELISKPNKGTVITIIIPMIENELI